MTGAHSLFTDLKKKETTAVGKRASMENEQKKDALRVETHKVGREVASKNAECARQHRENLDRIHAEGREKINQHVETMRSEHKKAQQGLTESAQRRRTPATTSSFGAPTARARAYAAR